MSLLITKNLYFREDRSARGNYVSIDNRIPPKYLNDLFTDEYSPIKAYLDTLEPNKSMTLKILIIENDPTS